MITPDVILRSKRKTIALEIDGFGKLTVRAPLRCKEELIFAFLQQKEGWILRKKAERAAANVQPEPQNLDGYRLLILGKETQITLYDGNRICLDEQRLYLPRKNSKKRLIAWLKTNAQRILEETAQCQAQRMRVSYQSLTVGTARGRWGSCTKDNRLRFTFRLLFAPKEVVEYVVIHELAHILQKNHANAFWRIVETYCSQYQRHRAWLKTHGGWMEIL